ncbi:MAG: hypothetical protein IPI40_00360 [Betaproteobacteria bacterium]|nr:hypothetical protein [Betaproteobacteria bacterium]
MTPGARACPRRSALDNAGRRSSPSPPVASGWASGSTALVPWLGRNNVPPAVSAGLVLSLALAGLRASGAVDLTFSTVPRDVLLLVFFASLGFGAHLGRLASAGKGALVICLAVLLAIVGQNLVGTTLAGVFGQPAALGPFLGSIAFIGGHGTAVAWSNSPAASGIPTAFPVGIGSATLGLVLGGLAAGPIAAWLARHGTPVPPGGAAVADASPVSASPLSRRIAGCPACCGSSSRWRSARCWVPSPPDTGSRSRASSRYC